jgi:hypothetical protein
LGTQLCLRISLRTSISKKIHLGPQNGPVSENLLKIVNCQNGQKTVLSHLEKVGGPRYPPRSIGKKYSLTHLKVFGFDAYFHVPKENMSKLDKKDEKCIFIGYKYGLKGYKIWNPETKKVVYNRDVVFREIKHIVKQEVLDRI